MVALNCDLIGNNAIELNSSYVKQFKFCGYPNLLDYSGLSQVRADANSDILLNITVNIVASDLIELTIPFNSYPTNLEAGVYLYDVLLTKNDNSNQFYILSGRAEIIERVTK